MLAGDGSDPNKYLNKLKRQERVIEEVKLIIKPFYSKRIITKEQYKEILRKAVPKVRVDVNKLLRKSLNNQLSFIDLSQPRNQPTED